ncbi:hypothetical protein CHLRE_14g615634v5 [Chlamydomonas reinhardtii]|uniref:Uncharacterized protein n=1 Tax=Chlamydomonas reinhardtii TaxID=3055 RepID=A0A2K3CXN8_CHLRE|nr:uncharacterized protein CHLRE_14g615634v5 [Chlamydomonas reinhardtii]PNW73019.1 hypothetical protein CHLRE_14g615634v5 [Chlamydomonas reinhardtii]
MVFLRSKLFLRHDQALPAACLLLDADDGKEFCPHSLCESVTGNNTTLGSIVVPDGSESALVLLRRAHRHGARTTVQTALDVGWLCGARSCAGLM